MDQSEEKQPTHFGQWSKNSEDVLKTHFPLHRCCRDGDVDTLSLLLMKAQHGIYSEDCFYGWTPVHWAAYFGKLGCLRKLMSVTRIGVDCDILTAKFRQTPCHVAAYGGHPYSLQWLLQSDANKDAQDYLGETPLHKAARTGSIECISLLISHGADVRVENNHKQTACDLAQSCGYLECCQFLTAAMSQNGTSVDRMKLLPPRESMERIAAGLNGGLVPPMSPTISSNGHSQDCDMDTVDASPIVNGCHKSLFQTENQRNGSVMVSNGHTPVQGSYGFLPRNGGHAMNGAGDYLRNVHATAAPSNGDILLADGVRCNSVPVAGRKRSREDDEQTEYKRLRTAGSCAEPGPSLVVVHKTAQCSACVHTTDEVDGPLYIDPTTSILQVPTDPMTHQQQQQQQHYCTCGHRSLYVAPAMIPPGPVRLPDYEISHEISPMASVLQVSTSPLISHQQRSSQTTNENFMIFVT